MAGMRSLLAPWMGGAASSSAPNDAGVRSMLAPWMGGAAVPAPVASGAGYTGLLAFWMGGASATFDTPIDHPATGGTRVRLRGLSDMLRRRLITEDDLLLLLAVAVDGNSLKH